MKDIKTCIPLIFALATVAAPGALVITEVMSDSGGTGATNGDWFELTNTGAAAVDVTGYYWDDDGPAGNDGALFPGISIPAGGSVVIVDEGAGNLADWLVAWGGGFTAISADDFAGPDTFSGLSSAGDQIEIWDADPNAGPANLVASVTFGAATTGSSFEWDLAGNPLGLSVAGENGATTGTQGDIASPGSVVPEPSIALLGGLGLLGMLRRRR